MKRLKSGFPRAFSGLLACLFATLVFTGCYDLGEYGEGMADGDYSAYYDTFGEVTAIYGTGDHTYDVEDSLFNTETVDHLRWDTEKGQVEVTHEDYLYIVIPFEQDITVECINLFLQGDGTPENSGVGEILAFLLEDEDDIPEKIRKRGDPAYEEIEDEDAPGGKRWEEIIYDDPDAETAVASATAGISGTTWTEISFSAWHKGQTRTSTIAIEEGNILLLRMENNTGYREDELPPLRFRFTNLLVRRAD